MPFYESPEQADKRMIEEMTALARQFAGSVGMDKETAEKVIQNAIAEGCLPSDPAGLPGLFEPAHTGGEEAPEAEGNEIGPVLRIPGGSQQAQKGGWSVQLG